jgi:hypothetical protein
VAAVEQLGGLGLCSSSSLSTSSAPSSSAPSRPRRLPGVRPRRVQARGEVFIAPFGGLVEARRSPRDGRRRGGAGEEQQEAEASPSL